MTGEIANKAEFVGHSVLEERLFNFLLSVRNGKPEARAPISTDKDSLRQLYMQPHPVLQEILRHCIETILVDLEASTALPVTLEVPGYTFGLALAAHNCIAASSTPPDDFTTSLVSSLAPACNLHDAIAYHAVLRKVETNFPRGNAANVKLLLNLFERSPLSTLWNLHLYTPALLEELGVELLPGWKPLDPVGASSWRNHGEWLRALISILSDIHVARWVRNRWIALPETRLACRNVGLLLELLRRYGDHRRFVLDFYACYERCSSKPSINEKTTSANSWPILGTIDKMLRVPGDTEYAILMNRRGNEYFVKFWPLVQIVLSEGVIPTDYVSQSFVGVLRPLLDFVTVGTTQGIVFGNVRFGES